MKIKKFKTSIRLKNKLDEAEKDLENLALFKTYEYVNLLAGNDERIFIPRECRLEVMKIIENVFLRRIKEIKKKIENL